LAFALEIIWKMMIVREIPRTNAMMVIAAAGSVPISMMIVFIIPTFPLQLA
jgi:hypothetical protein